MTIATKSELRTALNGSDGFLHRTFTTAKLDEFILMGESRLNRALRMLDMVTSQTGSLSTSVRTLALPTRFQDKIQFRFTSPLTELVWVPASQLMEYSPEESTSGQPNRYTITDSIEFDRIPDSAYAYVFKYYKGYRLTEDSDTNYVLTNYPQAYLFATALEAANYARDFELAQVMSGQLKAEIAEIKRAEARRSGREDARLTTELASGRAYNIDQD